MAACLQRRVVDICWFGAGRVSFEKDALGFSDLQIFVTGRC